jgi:hypothetical protein
MFKLLLSFPVLLASAALFANTPEHAVSSQDEELVARSHCRKTNSINTTFVLTPVGTVGYTLDVVPVSQRHGNFAIASDGTITLPDGGRYLLDFNLNFSNDPATQSLELNMLWNGIGAFQIVDSNSSFVASVLNFEGPTYIQSEPKSPLTIQTIFENFGPIATLVQLNGTITIKKLSK